MDSAAELEMAALGTPLDVSELICVSRPYYALQDLVRLGPGEVQAKVPVQAPVGRQAAVISIGEVGRHLAILGSCGAATINPVARKHYYLAVHAHCDWLAPPVVAAAPAPVLVARARCEFVERRKIVAHTELAQECGQVVARLRVTYIMLSERAFAAVSGAPGPTIPVQGNPYARALPFTDLTVKGDRASAALRIDSALCPGHFDGMPMLPVAVAISGLATLGEHVMQAITGTAGARWTLRSSDVQAHQLARAGRTAVFSAQPVPGHPADQRLAGTVHVGGELIAQADMHYTLMP
jgi:3-hydroxymyristoyl/3-hydroxydecanoyl-(acyl carrier protein) dehydratase